MAITTNNEYFLAVLSRFNVSQARKADEEAKKIGGVDTQEALKRIEEAASRIELNQREGNYKDALKELATAEKEATNALTSLREMQEGLTKAQINEAFSIAEYYSEKGSAPGSGDHSLNNVDSTPSSAAQRFAEKIAPCACSSRFTGELIKIFCALGRALVVFAIAA